MKKSIFLLAILFILGFCTAGFAIGTFRDSGGPSSVPNTSALANFRCSKNVIVQVNSAAQTYSVVSGHPRGNREFGAGSVDTKIYFTSKNVGDNITSTDPSSNNATKAFSGWSTL